MKLAHGRLFKHGGWWQYTVSVGGRTYLADSVGDFGRALSSCLFDVAALNRIYSAGHKLKHSWPELVERAGSL